MCVGLWVYVCARMPLQNAFKAGRRAKWSRQAGLHVARDVVEVPAEVMDASV